MDQQAKPTDSVENDPNRTLHPNFKVTLEMPARAIILAHNRKRPNPHTLVRIIRLIPGLKDHILAP